MQIKQYIATDIQEALRSVKEEMGEDAIILSTKNIPAAPGNGRTPAGLVEITAAVDRPSKNTMKPGGDSTPAGGLEVGQAAQEEALFRKIISSGLAPEFIQEVVADLKTFPGKTKKENLASSYREFLSWRVMENIDVAIPDHNETNIWSFIGPTGVGKTTTLVKLAALYRLRVTERITLVTIDTFRIGAVEQLRQYAQILRLPLEVAYNPEELKAILARNRHQDLILIDTAGRSPGASKALDELQAFLCGDQEIDNHLVLSATTKDEDLQGTIERFSVLPISSYIFTKIDETSACIPLFNQLFRFKKPLSYLTNGQNVPADIEAATKMKFADLVVGGISWC